MLKLILDNSYDEISLIDAKGMVLYVNPVCQKNYGLCADDVIGKTIWQLFDQESYDISIGAEVLSSKQEVQMQQTYKNGRRCLVSASPILDENGDLKFIITNSHDITELENALEHIKNQSRTLAQYKRRLASSKRELLNAYGFVWRSPKRAKLIELAENYAAVDSTILMTSETGTGKSMLARLIHDISHRRQEKMVSINCAAIPGDLLESELFGHAKGAFSGALQKGKPGLIETADKGTLFLDEIGDLPLSLQGKLLSFLQDRRFRRVGSTREISVDVRLICATNRDLTKMLDEKTFRPDLFYRINVLHLDLPPLRECREDIVPMIFNTLEKYEKKYGKQHRIEKDVLQVLQSYSWPGNIRELENVVEQLIVVSRGQSITLMDLPDYIHGTYGGNFESESEIINYDQAMEACSLKLIKAAHARHGSSYKVAECLGISQSKASRLIRKHLGP